MAGMFEIRKQGDGRYRFILRSADGSALVNSKLLPNRYAAIGTTIVMRVVAQNAVVIDECVDS